MACSLPPDTHSFFEEEGEDEAEEMVRVSLYARCSLSLDPATRAGVLLLHDEEMCPSSSSSPVQECLPGIVLDERGLVQTIVQLRLLLQELRLLPLQREKHA